MTGTTVQHGVVPTDAGDAVGEARPEYHGREHTRGTTAVWTIVQSRHTCALLIHRKVRRIGMEYAGSAWDEPSFRGVVWGLCTPRYGYGLRCISPGGKALSR